MAKKFNIDLKKKKCVTPEGRAGYVAILEKRQLPNSDDEAYGLQLMLPKSDVVNEFVEELKKLYAQVLIDKHGKKKAGELWKVIMAKNKFPVRDGDDPREAELSNAEQLAGHYFINTNNRFKQPFVLGPAGKAIDISTLTPDDIYSGMWCRCMLEFWYYDKAGNKGISTSIAGLMKTKDDDNLGVGTTKTEAEDAFGDFADEAQAFIEYDKDVDDTGFEEAPKDDVDNFDFM